MKIRVTDRIVIDADIEDGWFSILDEDNFEYDEPGCVLLGTEDITSLIESLFILLFKKTAVSEFSIQIGETAKTYELTLAKVKVKEDESQD